MADGRKNNGGARKGAGRKPKDEELKSKRLTINALVSEFGSEQEAFKYAAGQIKTNNKQSFNFFKLLVEYAYGKPKETIDLTTDTTPQFDFSDLSDEEIIVLSKIHARKFIDSNDSTD